jgi:ubiquinone/menaquinone biosynthesis C-methylase UbiE
MSPRARALCTSLPYRALTRWILLPWGLQGLSLSGEALEIGCGSGAMAAQLLRKFPQLRLVATDFDPEMVAVAGRRLTPFGERATTQRADATALPFADGRFDVVLSFAMLHHAVDWERAIGEAVRVLRPGGHLVGYDVLHRSHSRHLHHDEGGSMRTIGPGKLEAELKRLPVTSVRTRLSAAGYLLKFLATRA